MDRANGARGDGRGDGGGEQEGAAGESTAVPPVLVPLDGSSLAERALPHAIRIAQERRAPLLLVRVVAPRPLPGWEAGAALDDADAVLDDLVELAERQDAQRYLDGQEEAIRAAAPGLVVTGHVAIGDPAATLLDVEARRRAQLVVMTTHSRRGLERWVRGSVAERLVRDGRAPVLLVRPWDALERLPGPARAGWRVLVALDGSALAETVLPAARALAEPNGGELILFSVVPAAPPSHGFGTPPSVGVARGEVRRYLKEVASRLRDRPFTTRVVVPVAADVAGAIVDLAVTMDADLIALSTHGRGGLSRWLYGSVADRVARMSRVPVLLVHVQTRAESASTEPATAPASPATPVAASNSGEAA